jgi:flagellar hook-associated protein 2
VFGGSDKGAGKSGGQNPPGSADKLAVSSSVFTPLSLNGVSQYASDFQSILNRAVQIAQIPVIALQNKDSDVLQQKNLLSGLSSAVAGLATSLSSLGTTAARKALGATSSDPTVVSVTNNNAPTATTYTIDSITSTATAAAERSAASFRDSAATPVSSTGALELVVGSHNYDFTLTNNSLVGLRDQINSLAAGVTASILTTANGNYLSIAANSTGAAKLQLIDDPITASHPNGANANLLTSTNQGTDAIFQLDGIDITQSTNTVNNVIPGVTFTLLGSSDSPVTLSLASDRTQLSSAVQDFVTNYNGLQSELRSQVGPAAGLLSGDVVITQLQSALRQLTSYRTGSGTVKSLSDLGISFDSTGQASFNQNAFDSLSDIQISDAFSFLGSASTGFSRFSATFRQFSEPVNGLIRAEQDGLTRTDQNIQRHITTLTDRIAAMQTSLSAQLRAADAAVAELRSQQQSLTASLQGLNLVLYGKNQNTLG